MGFSAARIDLSGVGESPVSTQAGQQSARTVAEARRVMDFLVSSRACSSFLTAGFCTGGTLALELACIDARVRAALVINGLPSADALKEVRTRRIPTLALFSDGSPAFQLSQLHLADSGAAVSTHHHGTSVQVVQDCDHHLTLLSAQEEVLALVTSWLVRVRDVLSQ
jgi:dienelactone hydrolase